MGANPLAQHRAGAHSTRDGKEPAAEIHIRHAGGGWSIRYGETSFVLPDFKGIGYLAHLLARPGSELHVADLVAAVEGFPAGAGTDRPRLSHAGEILDPRARAEYRARLAEIESEVEEAVANQDLGRLERLRTEREFLRSELAAAYGLGGRARRGGDMAERARKAVRNRIRTAMEKIASHAPELADHLTATIRTGMFCVYEPPEQMRWSA